MKTVLVSGAAGSIGSELCRQLIGKYKVVALDQDESGLFDLKGVVPEIANIRDRQTIADIFNKYNPKIVFHTAAYKHLSNFEKDHYEEIVKTNIMGTVNVLRESQIHKAKFIFISTDKAVNPTSLMGSTKLVGEIMTKRCGGIVVRFGNVMGSRGSVIPIWEKQVQNKQTPTITDERMERYFMTIKEACTLVIEASRNGRPGELIILDMGKQKKVVDIFKQLYGDMPYKVIGAKEGEKLSEELLTDDEKKTVKKRGRFFII